jgi:hypothetical protein
MFLANLHSAGALMKKIIIEQSDTELYTGHSGLGLIGLLLNEHTTLVRRASQSVPGNPSVSHGDVLTSYIGLLALGKSDFEAATGVRRDEWFKSSLGIRKVPSAETLRQRLDRFAPAFEKCVGASTNELLKNTHVPITPVASGHAPLDIDVFTLDNSDTKKEGVSYTYQGYDGYAPIAAYLGLEGWCVGMELREGSQHSQTNFIPFLDRSIKRAREVTGKPLLVRLDAAHDSIDTLAALSGKEKVSYVVKWNPRSEDRSQWRDRAFSGGKVSEPRLGKKIALLSLDVWREHKGKIYPLRLVLRVTERAIDRRGQMLIPPEIELEGWWTPLNSDEKTVIELYAGRGVSEQFHGEIKTDLDVERLPSGKFATNSLVLSLAGFVYNMLRIIGQFGLLGPDSPVRHPAKRRRIRTVMQEIMYLAGRLIRTGRNLKLRFSRHLPLSGCFTSGSQPPESVVWQNRFFKERRDRLGKPLPDNF